jgi:hypothetical protein
MLVWKVLNQVSQNDCCHNDQFVIEFLYLLSWQYFTFSHPKWLSLALIAFSICNPTPPLPGQICSSMVTWNKIEEKIKIIIAKVLQQMLFKTGWVTIWSSSLVFTLMKPVTQYFFIIQIQEKYYCNYNNIPFSTGTTWQISNVNIFKRTDKKTSLTGIL